MFEHGVIRRALVELVDSAAPRGLAVVASYIEVFGSQLRCLTRGEDVNYARRAEAVALASAQDVDRFLSAGEGNKRAAATAMNEKSTRAHAVVTARLSQLVETTPAQTSVLIPRRA